jgi:hypothetical protein
LEIWLDSSSSPVSLLVRASGSRLDEQLAATKKGLQGLAMPNFGDARKTLAKEASWEPEPEPEETEEERE